MALGICSSVPLAAQTATTGVVLGKVTDPQGALVAGAEVVLTDTATNLARTQRTNDAGLFTFAGVMPGPYTMKVTAPGFRAAEFKAVTVEVNRSFTADITLEVGDLSSTVEVSAVAGTELQMMDAQLGNVLGEKMMRRLPTRRTQHPGVAFPPTGNDARHVWQRRHRLRCAQRPEYAAARRDRRQRQPHRRARRHVHAGARWRRRHQRVSRDGCQSKRGVWTFCWRPDHPQQSARVEQRSAESATGIHQNDDLNANTWANNRIDAPKAELEDKRGGFSLGGPIFRNKTFFFSNYEARRFPRSLPFTRTVPSASMRSGVLTFLDASGQRVAYPLATSTLCGAGGTTPCDPRGLGLSPTVREMFALMPAGNEAGDGLNTDRLPR